jgi:hypothetical protein
MKLDKETVEIPIADIMNFRLSDSYEWSLPAPLSFDKMSACPDEKSNFPWVVVGLILLLGVTAILYFTGVFSSNRVFVEMN